MIDTSVTPSIKTILPFYTAGAIWYVFSAFLFFYVYLFFNQHYFHPYLLSVTHMIILGWLTTVIFGALFQLLPVISGKPLPFEKGIRIIFCTYHLSLAIFCYCFYYFKLDAVFIVASITICLSIFGFAITAITALRETKNTASDFISTSMIWLCAVALLGVLMVLNFRYAFLPGDHLKFLKIHFLSGLGGWFLLLIIGITSKLLPMFLLSDSSLKKYLPHVWTGINVTLITYIANMLFNWQIPDYIFLIPLFFSFILYLLFIFHLYKKRVRKKLDASLKHTRYTFFILILSFVLMVVLTFLQNPSANYPIAFFMLAVAGFIGYLILVQIFKTLPFIAWAHIYKINPANAGKPSDLFSEKSVNIHGFLYLIAVLLLTAGILFNQTEILFGGIVLFLVAALLFLSNLFLILKKIMTYE
jgi:hypothetical protein